jgi:hypothetical protein
MTSEFAFVLGTGRCGSTLVHELVARHPDVGFLSNLEDRVPLPAAAGRWNSELYRRVPEALTRKGRLRFAPSEGYRALERVGSPALTAPVRDLLAEDVTPWLDARLRRFFEDRAHAQRKPVFLHKFTGWARAGLLGRVFPEARFVHVLRDGRAVANSFLQMPWWRGYAGPSGWGWGPLPAEYAAEWESSGRSFAVLAGIQWKLLIDAFEAAKAQFPPERWLEIRYEDLVADPRRVAGEVLDFLGLAWTPPFETQFLRTPITSARTDAYRSDLGIHELAMLEASLREHLERYAYLSPRRRMPGDETQKLREDSGTDD